MSTHYEPIPERFSKYGDEFTLIERDGDFAVYERVRAGVYVQHEVMLVRRKDAGDLFGVPTPAQEILPSTTQWGVFGWTVLGGLDRAREKIEREKAKRGLSTAIRKRARRAGQ